MSCKPDIEAINARYELYQQGFSLADVGKAFGVSRQTIFMQFSRAGKTLRTIKPLPFITYGGKRYTLRTNGYYACTGGKRQFLHRAVWEKINGPISDGYDIHHIDGDKANNHIDNLELISKSEHASEYPGRQNQHTK